MSGHDNRHFCAGTRCPGYTYPASFLAHPSTCLGPEQVEGRGDAQDFYDQTSHRRFDLAEVRVLGDLHSAAGYLDRARFEPEVRPGTIAGRRAELLEACKAYVALMEGASESKQRAIVTEQACEIATLRERLSYVRAFCELDPGGAVGELLRALDDMERVK